MTRVNVVPVTELCDQHLLAEHREIKRIPNCLISGKLSYEYDDRPECYVLGPGHVKFFTNKLRWLYLRYIQLHEECLRRNFNVEWMWPDGQIGPAALDIRAWNDYKPDAQALRINRKRIKERMPVMPRWTNF